MPTNEPIGATPGCDDVHILIIDDDNINAMLAKGVLERRGATVQVASNPVRALEAYARDKDAIDLVLVDYFMPTLDGGATVQHLRKLNPAVKVVLFSGAEEMRLRQLIHQFSIDGYVHKPLRAEEAVAAIRRLVPDPIARRATPAQP
jgi:CheY-like chemotaxis protein